MVVTPVIALKHVAVTLYCIRALIGNQCRLKAMFNMVRCLGFEDKSCSCVLNLLHLVNDVKGANRK